jgi:hypothetical protein
MSGDEKSNYKYVFVCGLHRSGTSVLANNIGRLENCTGFKNTPASVPDEGQNLQDVYPFEAEYGGPGRFGLDPRAHLTERSELLRPDKVARLRASWHSYWDKSKTIFVEKTPGNLLMTRFLQAAFPNSYFIVIRRHPIPVCMGTPKLGQASATSLHNLFKHWLHCHQLFEEDKKHLKQVYELTYEDYIEDPGRYHCAIAAFIGTTVPKTTLKEVNADRSKKYFDRWSTLLTSSFFRDYYQYIARKYDAGFLKYGYSLVKWPGLDAEALRGLGEISPALGGLYCRGADACAFTSRLFNWPPPNTRRRIKALLPKSILMRINQARQKTSVAQDQPEATSP